MAGKRWPKVGSAALVRDDHGDMILLGRRGKEPNFGRWVMPGGKVEWGETLEIAAVREVQEETGLIVRPVSMGRLGIFEIVNAIEHSVFVLTECIVIGGKLQAGDDLSEVQWVHRNQLRTWDLSAPCYSALSQVGWIEQPRRIGVGRVTDVPD